MPAYGQVAEIVDPSGLPKLVRDYVDRVLPSDAQTRRTVRVEQIGEMVLKPRAKPRAFTATEEFAIDRVAFAWNARLPIAGPLGLRVTDRYDGRDGRLEVRLLGLPLQRKHGTELARGEAFRYLAEIAWVPSACRASRSQRRRRCSARASSR